MRTIRRYANRKLYDTITSRYCTLADVARFVRAGEEVQVIGHRERDDQTAATLLQVLLEEERAAPSGALTKLLVTVIRGAAFVAVPASEAAG